MNFLVKRQDENGIVLSIPRSAVVKRTHGAETASKPTSAPTTPVVGKKQELVLELPMGSTQRKLTPARDPKQHASHIKSDLDVQTPTPATKTRRVPKSGLSKSVLAVDISASPIGIRGSPLTNRDDDFDSDRGEFLAQLNAKNVPGFESFLNTPQVSQS